VPVTVSAAVRRDNDLLFVRETYGDFKGLWTFPAGFVDAGEQPDVAAIRETYEEAGVVCAIEGLVSVVTILWRGAPMLYLIFLARYVSGEPTPDGRETDAAAFWGLDALDALPFDGQNAFVARRILTGESKVLLPHENQDWFADHRTTYL
jgi:ADP-ribose pyrophosphatase YjhB (NUDIX family)